MAQIELARHLQGKKTKTLIDNLMSLAAVVHPMTAVPQVVQIYQTHDVAGISLVTWFGFMTIGLVFLAYGILHKIKPFIVTQVLWFVVDFLVVAGVLMYR